MSIRSVLKLLKIAWPSPFKLGLTLTLPRQEAGTYQAICEKVWQKLIFHTHENTPSIFFSQDGTIYDNDDNDDDDDDDDNNNGYVIMMTIDNWCCPPRWWQGEG